VENKQINKNKNKTKWKIKTTTANGRKLQLTRQQGQQEANNNTTVSETQAETQLKRMPLKSGEEKIEKWGELWEMDRKQKDSGGAAAIVGQLLSF